MSKFKRITLVLSASLALAMFNSKRGAVLGGLIGAGTGAIIGHQSGRGLEGAAIGGAVGAGGGALLGSARDDDEARYEERRHAEQHHRDDYRDDYRH